jgi:soluble lytic murein transglycosylase-like protein
MQSAVIQHSRLEDEGLKFYRNPEFKESVTWFYTQITGNKVVTEAILMAANENDIPLSLAFALAYSESSYNVKAVNRNSNHTIDRGLFQLNNNSFPSLREDEFFDPYVSAKYGLSHLRFCLDTAGNEVAALAMYNAGIRRVKNGETPQVTLNYVSKIMNYKNGVDDLFDFQSENWLDSTLFETIAFLR